MKALLLKFIFLLFSAILYFPFECEGQMAWNWAMAMGGLYGQTATDVVCDTDGNIFITASFWNSADIGNIHFITDPNGGSGGIVAKFDSNGKLIWANQVNLDNENKSVNAISATGRIRS